MKISTLNRRNENGRIEKKVQFGPRKVEKLGVGMKRLERMIRQGWMIILSGRGLTEVLTLAREAGIEVEVTWTHRGWYLEVVG